MCLVSDYGKNMVISGKDMLCFHGNRWSRQNSKIKQIWVSLLNLLCNILNPSYSIALISSVNFTNEPFGAFQFFHALFQWIFLINWRQWYLQNRTYICLYQSLNTVPKALLLNPNTNQMISEKCRVNIMIACDNFMCRIQRFSRERCAIKILTSKSPETESDFRAKESRNHTQLSELNLIWQVCVLRRLVKTMQEFRVIN